VQVFI